MFRIVQQQRKVQVETVDNTLLYAEAIRMDTVRRKRKVQHLIAATFMSDTVPEQREVDEHTAVLQMCEALKLKLHAEVTISNTVQEQRKVDEHRVVQHMCAALNTEESQPLIDVQMSRPSKGKRRTRLSRSSRKGIRSRKRPSSMSGQEWSVHTRNTRMTKLHTA